MLGDVDKDWKVVRRETLDRLSGGAKEKIGSGPGRVRGGGFLVVLWGQAGGCDWVV